MHVCVRVCVEICVFVYACVCIHIFERPALPQPSAKTCSRQNHRQRRLHHHPPPPPTHPRSRHLARARTRRPRHRRHRVLSRSLSDPVGEYLYVYVCMDVCVRQRANSPVLRLKL